MSENKLTPSLEDYLETILFLSENNPSVRITDVADKLGISKPSVNKAINILKKDGYVDHEHYGLLSLTDEGKEIAKDVAVRHFAIKSFLCDVLGVEEAAAAEEACKLEHSMTKDTVAKLKDFLDRFRKVSAD